MTSQCLTDGEQYLGNLTELSLWAWKMLDSNPIWPPPGVLKGNVIHFPGSFSSCLEADAGSFTGKHCLMRVGATKIQNETEEMARVQKLTGGQFRFGLPRKEVYTTTQ